MRVTSALLLFLSVLFACGGRQAPAKLLDLTPTAGQIEASLPAGYVSIVDFWAEYCGACKVVIAKVEETVQGDRRIVIRKVDVGDGYTAIAKAYQIGALPHLRIYDRKRALRYILVGNDALTAGQLAIEVANEK